MENISWEAEAQYRNYRAKSKPIFYKDKWNLENLRKLGLNESQIKAVQYVIDKGKITNREYLDLNQEIGRITAPRDLAELKEKGVLIMTGTGKREIQYILNASRKMQKMQ